MKDLKLITIAGVTTALVASNLIIGKQYIDDSKKYEQKINHQYEIIKQYKVNERKDNSQIATLTSQLDQLKQEKQQQEQILNQSEINNQRKLFVQVTAYVNDCEGCSGTTFSGYNVNNTTEYNGLEVIAMDTSIIPLYSVVRIDTENQTIFAIVLDKGGAIKGNKVDLLVNSYDEAINFGKQKAVITVLREGKR